LKGWNDGLSYLIIPLLGVLYSGRCPSQIGSVTGEKGSTPVSNSCSRVSNKGIILGKLLRLTLHYASMVGREPQAVLCDLDMYLVREIDRFEKLVQRSS
jgi:hypothetical protein